jgi:hypothetical protein
LKQSKTTRCIEACGKVLSLIEKQTAPQNPDISEPQPQSLSLSHEAADAASIAKALFRRAKAYTLEKDFTRARQDSQRAAKLSPQDAEIRKLLQELKDIDKEYEDKQKRELQGFFDKGL